MSRKRKQSSGRHNYLLPTLVRTQFHSSAMVPSSSGGETIYFIDSIPPLKSQQKLLLIFFYYYHYFFCNFCFVLYFWRSGISHERLWKRKEESGFSAFCISPRRARGLSPSTFKTLVSVLHLLGSDRQSPTLLTPLRSPVHYTARSTVSSRLLLKRNWQNSSSREFLNDTEYIKCSFKKKQNMRSTVFLVAVILLFGDCAVHSAAVKTQPTVTKGIQQTVCLLFSQFVAVRLPEMTVMVSLVPR